MLKTHKYPKFAYVQSDEQRTGKPKRHQAVVIGAGPVGLTAALDFACRGIETVVIDDSNTVSIGSRAVCYAKRSLEIWDRLNCGDRLVAKGESWNVGKVFFRDKLSYQFDLLAEADHKMPAMINLQQYYLEEYLIDEATRCDGVELRWKHRLLSLKQADDHVVLRVEELRMACSGWRPTGSSPATAPTATRARWWERNSAAISSMIVSSLSTSS